MKRYIVLLLACIITVFSSTAFAQTPSTIIDLNGYKCSLPFYSGEIITDEWSPSIVDRQVGLIALGYDLGPSGADGIWGPMSEAARLLVMQSHPNGLLSNSETCTVTRAMVEHQVATLAGWTQVYNSLPANGRKVFTASVIRPSSSDGYQAPGNGYGEVSPRTGLPRNNYVRGYTRSNGTVVQPYYRSHR